MYATSRPEFDRLLADIAAGKLAVVASPSLTELCPTTYRLELLYDALSQAEQVPAFAFDDDPAGNLDLSTPVGRMTGRLLVCCYAVSAEARAAKRSARIRAGIAAKKAGK